MYSLIQKQVEQNNERILVIVGAQHAAAFQEFSANDNNVEIILPGQLLNK